MKKLTILLFSIFISFNSYGKWEELFESVDGDTYYIDIDTIKERDGYVYYWYLVDLVKPTELFEYLSGTTFLQVDCGFPRFKEVSSNWYTVPMGRGIGISNNIPREWDYFPPGSVGDSMVNYVCDYVD